MAFHTPRLESPESFGPQGSCRLIRKPFDLKEKESKTRPLALLIKSAKGFHVATGKFFGLLTDRRKATDQLAGLSLLLLR